MARTKAVVIMKKQLPPAWCSQSKVWNKHGVTNQIEKQKRTAVVRVFKEGDMVQ